MNIFAEQRSTRPHHPWLAISTPREVLIRTTRIDYDTLDTEIDRLVATICNSPAIHIERTVDTVRSFVSFGRDGTSEEIRARIDRAVSVYPVVRDFGTTRPLARLRASRAFDLAGAIDLLFVADVAVPDRSSRSLRHLAGFALRNWHQLRAQIGRALRIVSPGDAEFVEAMLDFLETQLPQTFDALPHASVRQGAISKIIRGFFGVHMYAMEAHGATPWKKSPERDAQFALAYAYGSAYALVDNLIDTDFFADPRDKELFLDAVAAAFEGRDAIALAPKAPYTRELARLFDQAAPAFERRPDLLELFRLFSSAQRQDNRMCHSALVLEAPERASARILSANMRKASLTRLSARAIATDKPFEDREALLLAALNNQLSNDIEGFAEDLCFGQVTLFTHQLHAGHGYDAFDLMLRAGSHAIDRLARNGGADVALATDIFVVRLLEVAIELRGAGGLDRLMEIVAPVGSPAARAVFDALLCLGTKAPTPHPEMLLLGAVDIRAERLWRERRGAWPLVRRWLIETAERHGAALERRLRQLQLSSAAQHTLFGDCSRSRPYLILSLVEQLGGDAATTIDQAAAVECFHTASLILDDLPAQDDADERRSKPTSHRVFGEAAAQLAAVELISTGYSLLAAGEHAADLVRAAHHHLAGPDGLCRGQLLDLEANGSSMSEALWRKIASAKTARPFAFCAELCTIVTGTTVATTRLSEIATQAGLLYQLRDDIEDGGASALEADLACLANDILAAAKAQAALLPMQFNAAAALVVGMAEELDVQIARAIKGGGNGNHGSIR